MAKPAKRNSPQKRYTPNERKQALIALAYEGGHVKLASERCGVSDTTIRKWLRDDPTAYAKILQEMGPQLEELAQGQFIESVLAAAVVSKKILAELEGRVSELPAKDLAGALRNVDTSRAINQEKSLLLQGRPSQITQHRSLADVLDAMKRRGFIDGEAEEEPPALAAPGTDGKSPPPSGGEAGSIPAGATS